MTEAMEEREKKSLLFDRLISSGADFADRFGWLMADSYGDTEKEYRSVRQTAGLVDLSFCGAIKIGGKEGAQFLHGLVTNDVKALEKGKGMRAAFLTGHGKVRAFCRILALSDGFLVINDPQTHEKVFKYVFPFSYAGDFKVEDVSEQYRMLSLQGPASGLVLKEICFEPVPQLEEQSWVENMIAGHHILIAAASHTGELGYDILVSEAGINDVWDFTILKGEFHSLAPVGLRAVDALRIEAGIPVYGIDVDETNMMLEAGLPDAVSFSKGCYTGQEAVAMATYRGHVSKRLSGLAVDGDIVPSHGDRIEKDGKDIGQITSSIRSQTLSRVIALGLVKYGFFDPGTRVQIRSGERALNAEIVDIPFYRRDPDLN
ncbi:MAG TPA: aminomethyltransferase family protein [Blastocatellia bacterium]|nr:aminomethyltransferase family protein [Blastocatellia bacterium]